ncbi:hypothetical protein LINPERHAP1_LOCUS2099 [Linum perenne]
MHRSSSRPWERSASTSV